MLRHSSAYRVDRARVGTVTHISAQACGVSANAQKVNRWRCSVTTALIAVQRNSAEVYTLAFAAILTKHKQE